VRCNSLLDSPAALVWYPTGHRLASGPVPRRFVFPHLWLEWAGGCRRRGNFWGIFVLAGAAGYGDYLYGYSIWGIIKKGV